MRALVFSSLLLSCLTATLTIFIICGPKMASHGYPAHRRGFHSTKEDILAGADFLSVLLESSHRRATKTASTTSPATIYYEDDTKLDHSENHIRLSRSSLPFAQTSTEQFNVNNNVEVDSSNDISKDGIVLAVSISSSVEKMINKELSSSDTLDETTMTDVVTISPTTVLDQNSVASEEQPIIVAKSSKSELIVDEREPITQERDLDLNEYPARVRAIPNHQAAFSSASYVNRHLNGKPQFGQLIYHNTPAVNNGARSVAFSTVIQGANEQSEIKKQHDRRERNYDGAQPYFNNYQSTLDRLKPNETKTSTDASRRWDHTEVITTERNWETQEKPYAPPSPTPRLPVVYGRPEQNYEIDEAVSVVTNGRAHGVQPSLPPKPDLKLKKLDDNQKVGYVVEGRNYRKYRVEERTADGFIVGEYGVVSHDDGSLRGVRYTADGTINPKVISEALLKFLSL